MKQEPELIDIFAMFAMMNQTNDTSLFGSDEYQRLIAERSYRMAQKMMETRKKFTGDKHE